MDQIVLEKKNLEDHLLPVNGDRKEEALVGEQLYQRIREMLESGKKKKVLARLFGIDIKTVRKNAARREWQAYQRRLGKPGLLEPYQDWIRLRAPEVGFNGRVILRELKEKGYTGSYDTLKHFLAPLRPHRAALEMTVRFETRPGQQAQVDWGSSLVWMGEAQSRIRFFVLTLGYSRRMFVRAFSNERLTSLIEGHEEAFRFFGGVTEVVLPDYVLHNIIVDQGSGNPLQPLEGPLVPVEKALHRFMEISPCKDYPTVAKPQDKQMNGDVNPADPRFSRPPVHLGHLACIGFQRDKGFRHLAPELPNALPHGTFAS